MAKPKRNGPDAFDQYFERKFRKSPLIIGLSLAISGFVSGFGAHSAMNSEHADSDPPPNASRMLEQCLLSMRDLVDQCTRQRSKVAQVRNATTLVTP